MTPRLIVYVTKMLAWAIRNSGKTHDAFNTNEIETVSEKFNEKLVS